VSPQGTSLRLSAPAERLRAAMKLREALLAKVAKRKASITAIETEADAASAKVASVMEPRWAKLRGFDDEIHQLLDAITGEPSRLPRERAILTRLYHSMQKAGVISRRADWEVRTGRADEAEEAHDERGREGADARGGRRGRGEPLRDFVESPDADEEVASARRPPESQHGGLRALFRRLVEAFHPDKVQDEDEKAARTEVMKDVTEAYRRGDLARLLELERRRAREVAGEAEEEAQLAAGDPEELERRLVALDQSCDELRAQLAELERAVRSVRRSPHAAMARELKRASRAGYDLVDLDVVRELDRAARDLRKMRDALTAFREERITLIDLLSTPALEGLHEDDDLLDTVTELARQMLQRERAAHASRDPRAAASQSSSDDRRRRR
jgi:hypothetical protein